MQLSCRIDVIRLINRLMLHTWVFSKFVEVGASAGGKKDFPHIFSGKCYAGSALGVQANWPNLARGGLYHGWLPLAFSLVAGCGLPQRTAGPRGHYSVRGTAGNGRSCSIVNQALLFPPIALLLLWYLLLSRPRRKLWIRRKQKHAGDFLVEYLECVRV